MLYPRMGTRRSIHGLSRLVLSVAGKEEKSISHGPMRTLGIAWTDADGDKKIDGGVDEEVLTLVGVSVAREHCSSRRTGIRCYCLPYCSNRASFSFIADSLISLRAARIPASSMVRFSPLGGLLSGLLSQKSDFVRCVRDRISVASLIPGYSLMLSRYSSMDFISKAMAMEICVVSECFSSSKVSKAIVNASMMRIKEMISLSTAFLRWSHENFG